MLFQSSLVRYLTVGVFNTIVGLGTIYFLKWQLHLGDASANACGYAIGFVLSFFLNKKLTFQFEGATWLTFVKFILVVLTSYAINLKVVLVAAHSGLNSYWAQAAGIAPYTITSYLGCRFFVFRRSRAR